MYSADVIDSHSGRTGSHCDPQGLNTGAAPDSRAVIILIPVRLGGEKINPEYLSFVKVRLWRDPPFAQIQTRSFNDKERNIC